MSESLAIAVSRLISQATGEGAEVVARSPLGGGCINSAEVVTLADGRRYFVKSNAAPLPRMFEAEADGLRALGEVGVLRVPMPIGVGHDRVPFLVAEFIETGPRGQDFEERLGRQLAEHHKASVGDRFGFDHDNYLGSTPQPNRWADSWPAFFAEHRLRYQVDLARRGGLATDEFTRLANRLIQRVPELLGAVEEAPVLNHGDLWSGNILSGVDGSPVLIDPAVHYATREAEFGMITLFGGVGERFHQAYEEVWPLPPGANDRIAIYRLYHLLNHLNLFGRGYMGDCLATMRRYAG